MTLSDSPVRVLESIFAADLTKPSWGQLLSAIESDVMAGRPIELQPVSTLVASLPDRNRRNSWKFQPFLLDDQTFHSFSTYNKKLAAIVVNSFSSVSVRKYKLSIYLLADFNAFLRLKLPGDVLVHDANICYGAKFGNQNSRRQWRSVVLKLSQKSLVFSFFFVSFGFFVLISNTPHWFVSQLIRSF